MTKHDMSVASAKRVLRSHIQSKIAQISKETLVNQSLAITHHVLEVVRNLGSSATQWGVYLSMPEKEVQTLGLIRKLMEEHKVIYAPLVTGRQSQDMQMLQLETFEEIQTFVLNRWNIPEPPLFIESNPDTPRTDLLSMDIPLDILIVPGVAFDGCGHRLGHGKGYYDAYIDRLGQLYQEKGFPAPKTIGLALEEQIVDSVPMDTFDQALDMVITPHGILYQTTKRVAA